MIPRPHQRKALDTLWTALQYDHAVLLEAACSAGKTLMFSKIIQRLLTENPSFRVLILMDREVLVRQTRDKLVDVAPELALDIGIVCASVCYEKVIDRRVTIASRQSLINILIDVEPIHLCVIDEVHLVATPKVGEDKKTIVVEGQYAAIINTLQKRNSKMRIFGVTATPYRLNDGYIYGVKNSSECRPYFEERHCHISVGELEEVGYLAPLIGKTAMPDGMRQELTQVGLVAGEYNEGRLSTLMEKGIHLTSAVDAWIEFASDRNKTLAFCVTINHAEKLAEAFRERGITSVAIHSQTGDLVNASRMAAFERGDHQVYCSVAKLTTGIDVPDIDCILMARPTKSTALYKQKLGRGQRIFPGKENCLVIDMVGNNEEHGTDLDKLKVRWNRGNPEMGDRPPSKECPECATDCHPAVKICPDCEYVFPEKTVEELKHPKMTDAVYGNRPPEKMTVDYMYITEHESRNNGRKLLRIRLELSGGEIIHTYKTASLWMCFEGDGYAGYAVEKGRELWKEMTVGENYPDSAEEAVSKANRILKPAFALVDLSDKYPSVKSLEYNETPF